MLRWIALGLSLAMPACNLLTGIGDLVEQPCVSCSDAAVDRTNPMNVDSSLGDGVASEHMETLDARVDDGDVRGVEDVVEADVCTPPAPPTLDECDTVPMLPAPPVIDGVLDCGIPLYTMTMQGWSGTAPNPATTELAIGWRPDGLYFYVRVHRPGGNFPAPSGEYVYCGDAVELFVDHNGMYTDPPNYDDGGTRQFVLQAPSSSQPSIAAASVYRPDEDLGPWTSMEFVVVRETDGFAAEAFVAAADIGLSSWMLSLGGKVGLDVQVDLGHAVSPDAAASLCGALLGRYDLRIFRVDGGTCGSPSCSVEEFCTPELTATP